MTNLLVLAVVVVLLSVADSVSTAYCFKQYPDKELKGEANPLMRGLMLKNRWLAEGAKLSFVLILVAILFVVNDIKTMRLAVFLFGLVVLNNTYVGVSRAIAKREVITPAKKLKKLLHIPDKYLYVAMMALLVSLALSIEGVIWGWHW